MYYVSEPCTYIEDGRVIVHRKAGAVVELSDEQAAELGDKVRLVGGDPDAEPTEVPEREVPVGAPAVIVEPRVDGVEGSTGDSVPDETPEPEADPMAERRARRSRGSDG